MRRTRPTKPRRKRSKRRPKPSRSRPRDHARGRAPAALPRGGDVRLSVVVVQFVVAAVVGAAAVVTAAYLRHRTRVDPPIQVPYAVPSQLDRRDFARPDAPW